MNSSDFHEIFATYERPIYNYVLRMVKKQEVAEELTQDIFLKISRNLSNFRGESKLATWIYQIATNTCRDYFQSASYKHSANTQSLEEQDVSEDAHTDETQRILSLEASMIKSEMSECIREFVDGLPEDYRAVIILHDLHGMKNREIADIINCALDTVKIRLHRARKKLRTVLASNCEFYRDECNVLSCDRKANEQQGENE